MGSLLPVLMLDFTDIYTNGSVVARPDEFKSFRIMIYAVAYEALTKGCFFDVTLKISL